MGRLAIRGDITHADATVFMQLRRDHSYGCFDAVIAGLDAAEMS